MTKFNLESIKNGQKNFLDCSQSILDNLDIIISEMKDINNILNTPRSSKLTLTYLDYLDEARSYLQNSHVVFDNKFDIIKNEYQSFVDDVKQSVGDSHE